MLALARRLFESFDTSGWEGMPTIHWHEVPLQEGVTVLANESWRVTASPGQHSVPVIGLRVEVPGGQAVAYSCDTGPAPSITRLAADAAILVHEATGAFAGHSSPQQAAQTAADARARRLLLVHLPAESILDDAQMAQARARFAATEKGEELGRYPF